MLQVVPQNAAELQRAYISSQIYKPNSISIEAYNARVKRLNGWIPDLPTLKDVEGSPETMPRGDVKMDEVELCLALLRALPKYLLDHYKTVKGRNHCETSVRDLTSDLMDIEPQAKSFQKLNEEVRAQGKLKSGSSQNPDKKSSRSEGTTAVTSPQKSQLTGRIPRKVRNTKTESSQPLAADFVQKHCNSCQQWSPRVANNHNTKECRNWNPDGSRKAKKFRPASTSTQKASFAMQKMEQMEVKMAKLENDNKKMKARLNKKVKGRSKKRKCASSTDMSDSDSD
jgi:DNA primase